MGGGPIPKARRALRGFHLEVLLGGLATLAAGAALLPAAAFGADSIYWTNAGTNLSFVALDASTGGDLDTTGTTVDNPIGVAIDPGAGRIYWGDLGLNKISFANLAGGGGGDLTAAGATLNGPYGVALDPAARRIYWANRTGTKISFASLDGTGGGDLNTTGATIGLPSGVAVDPAAGRIYWANSGNFNEISFANLDGSGGGDLNTTGATVDDAVGVAVDPAAGRIYWANNEDLNEAISFANLNGSGGADLNTTGATLDGPRGVAIDHGAGRIYWANESGKISFARLDGTGGADVPTLGATTAVPTFPALLFAPRPAGAPQVSGGSTVGSTLSCSQATWAADQLPSFLYQAPQSFGYQWSLGGSDIAGASSSTLTPDAPGDYRCRVTAQNHAGAAAQTSDPRSVSSLPPAAFGSATKVRLALAGGRIPARGPVKVRVANANGFAVTGNVGGQTTKKVTLARKRKVKLKAKRFAVAAGAKRTVKLKLPKPLRRVLAAKGKLSLRLTAKVTDPAGNTRTVEKKITPKLKKKKRRG